MRKIKAVVLVIIVVTAVYLASAVHDDYKRRQELVQSLEKTLTIKREEDKRLKIQQQIIEGFELKKELITHEVQISQAITLDDSWGDLSLFHKSQKIKIYGTGIYVCDLNAVDEGDIDIDFSNMIVTVTIPRPKVKSVTIDETKTEYWDVYKGWLRFGDITLTPRQHDAMRATVKKTMETTLNGGAALKEANESTITAVSQIFQELLESLESGFLLVVRLAD